MGVNPAPGISYRAIYAVVSRIPRGRVATYGQVARLAGLPGQARLVGYALAVLRDESPVPWHRVVNAKGQVSGRSDGRPMDRLQRLRLERERVRFDDRACISLAQFRWRPRPRNSGECGAWPAMTGAASIVLPTDAAVAGARGAFVRFRRRLSQHADA